MLDLELAVPKAPDRFGPNGELTDPETRERLAEVLKGLVAYFEQSAKEPVKAEQSAKEPVKAA